MEQSHSNVHKTFSSRPCLRHLRPPFHIINTKHAIYNFKQAFINIRLGPGVATPLVAVAARCSLHASATRPLRPNVHNIAQRRRRRTEPHTQNLHTKFREDRSSGSRDRGLCSRTERQTHTETHRQTDRHTDRRIDHNTPQPYRDGVKISNILNVEYKNVPNNNCVMLNSNLLCIALPKRLLRPRAKPSPRPQITRPRP